MLDQNEGKLIRINDANEFKVGMACKLISCNYCSKNHVFNITDIKQHNGHAYDLKGYRYPYNGLKFLTMPLLCFTILETNGWKHFSEPIKEGRLFAIVDENPIADEIAIKEKPYKAKRDFKPELEGK